MLMTVRDRLVSVKSQLSNAIRSYAAEFGIVGPAGRQDVDGLIKQVLEDDTLPEMASELFRLHVFGTRVANTISASGLAPRQQAGHLIASDRVETLLEPEQVEGRPHL